MTWPDNLSASAFYDAMGRLRQTTDERGVVANYLYDPGDRLNLVYFPAYPAQNLSATFDNAGRIRQIAAP